MKLIPLSRGMFAKVDDADYEWLMQIKWHTHINRKSAYAVGKRGDLKMHRHIMGVTNPEQIIDHIDGDGLNNQRSNLRVCTTAENMRNRKVARSSTGLKGVYETRNKKYCAIICANYKQICLGTYSTAEAAAVAYNNAALKYHGEFASLNKIDKNKLNNPSISLNPISQRTVPVVATDSEGNTIEEFNSLSDAGRRYGIRPSEILRYCQGVKPRKPQQVYWKYKPAA